MNILYLNPEQCCFAHWCKRFEEYILSSRKVPDYIISSVIESSCRILDFELFDAQIEPVIDKKNKVINGLWRNHGNKPRPKNNRFFENWNGNKKHFDTWIFESF
jgi:hypothetical protein